MSSQLVLFQKILWPPSFFFLKEIWKLFCRNLSITVLFGHFTENSEAPHQAVTANNLGNQASSAIPESRQQHPFDAVVTSCSGNGKSRRRIVSECFTVYYFTVNLLLKVSCFFGRKARCTSWSIWRPTRFLERVWRYEKLVFQANSCSRARAVSEMCGIQGINYFC